MGYSNISTKSSSSTKSDVKKSKKKLSPMRLLILCLGVFAVVRVASIVIEHRQERQQERQEAYDKARWDIQMIAMRSAAAIFLIDLESYYSKNNVDAVFELNAIQHKLKMSLDEIKSDFEGIVEAKQGLLQLVEKDRYDIIKQRREANETFSKYPPSDELFKIDKEHMAKMFKHYKKWVNLIFIRHLNESLSVPELDDES